MRTIGIIVVIAVIVFCAIKLSKKKSQSDEVADQAADGSVQEPVNSPLGLLQEIVSQPIEVLQQQLDQIQEKAQEQVQQLTKSVPLAADAPASAIEKVFVAERKPLPLVNEIASEEQILIAEPAPVTPYTVEYIPAMKDLNVGSERFRFEEPLYSGVYEQLDI